MPVSGFQPLRVLAPLFLVGLAVLTFATRYWEPRSLFWDENYHIASAHKDLGGVFYMETHPPLGKLLIAGGEALVGVNAGKDTAKLLDRDHVANADLPAGFSFVGVRLASVVSMILAVLLLYGCLLEMTGSRVVAVAFASLPALDNALVVHTRSAMLEGPQILFALLALYLVARFSRGGAIRLRHYVLLGIAVGLAVVVKLNAAVLLLLFVALFVADRLSSARAGEWGVVARRFVVAVPVSIVAVVLTFSAVYWMQFAHVERVEAQRTYKASAQTLARIGDGTTTSPAALPALLRDHLRYQFEYSEGVPRLDVCKPGENGSAASGWPLGTKAINYRWNRQVEDGRTTVAYQYLVANPAVWWPVLAGIVLSLVMILGRAVFGHVPRDARLFGWVVLMTALHVGYLLAMLRVERVMYLYHYLLPLVFGIVNLGLVFACVFADGLRERRLHTSLNLVAFVVLVAGVFVFFAPLTYAWPLTSAEFELRRWFAFWRLEPVA